MFCQTEMDGHEDAVPNHHRFPSKRVDDRLWCFKHLDPFALQVSVDLGVQLPTTLTVIVLFSNHCFTRSVKPGEAVPEGLAWEDARERRVMDFQRYEMSKRFLPKVIYELPNRSILFADTSRPNFVIFEIPTNEQANSAQRYAVFFEVEKDKNRKHRLLLRVQSAYVLEQVSQRQLKADKIKLKTLLRRAYLKGK